MLTVCLFCGCFALVDCVVLVLYVPLNCYLYWFCVSVVFLLLLWFCVVVGVVFFCVCVV